MNYTIVQEGSLTDVIYKFTIQEGMRPLVGDLIKIPGYIGTYKITRSVPSSDPSTQTVMFVVEPMSDLGPEFQYNNYEKNYLTAMKKGGGELYLMRPKDLGDNFIY